jgi:hypothetical protein
MIDWALNFYQPDGAAYLTLDEKYMYKKELMAMVDSDKNGKLNLEEFAVLFEQLRKDKTRNRKLKGALLPVELV